MQVSRAASRPALAGRGRLSVANVARPTGSRKVEAPKVQGRRLAETRLNALAAPLLVLPGLASAASDALKPSAEYFQTLGLPEALIHWGHPGNMAVVLFAMGGYGALYQGWQIRTSDDADVVAAAKDSHPKLAGAMFFFFLAGASGGMMSLLMQGKPIFESSHVVTGLIGLALLSVQATLPAFFKSGGESARTAHAFLGTSILALFLVHGGLGLQLGLSL